MIPTLIDTTTISSNTATVSFTGIDSTYDEYMFIWYGAIGENQQEFMFQVSTDNGSSYGVTLTSTFFHAEHDEIDSAPTLAYVGGGYDRAQETLYQKLARESNNSADDGDCGVLHLFSPSNTTYVKHFYAITNCSTISGDIRYSFPAGYFNTTSAVDALQFKYASGDIERGVFKIFGIA